MKASRIGQWTVYGSGHRVAAGPAHATAYAPATGDAYRGRHRPWRTATSIPAATRARSGRRDADQSRDGRERLSRGWSHAAWSAATSDEAPSCPRAPTMRARRSPGAARSPRPRCRRRTRPFETWSGPPLIRASPRSPPARRRWTAFPPPRFSARCRRSSPWTPRRRGVTDPPKVCLASAPRSRPGSAAIPSTSSSSAAHNRASISWRVASSIRATR